MLLIRNKQSCCSIFGTHAPIGAGIPVINRLLVSNQACVFRISNSDNCPLTALPHMVYSWSAE
jgi:hypothetical protein